VEYKGGYLYDAADAEEKRMVGEVWPLAAMVKCLFIMPSSKHYQEIKDFINKI